MDVAISLAPYGRIVIMEVTSLLFFSYINLFLFSTRKGGGRLLIPYRKGSMDVAISPSPFRNNKGMEVTSPLYCLTS